MNTRVWFVGLTVILAVSLVLGGCAPTAAPATKEAPPQAAAQPAPTQVAPTKPAEKVKLKLATWAGVDEAKELQGLLDKLNAASSSYEIIQESSPSEYWTKVQTTLAAGTAADLLWVDQDHLPDLAQKGSLLDITNYLQSDSRPAANLSDYFAAPLERYTFDGKYYGLPWIAMPVMFYVNLDQAQAAGLDENKINDWDWEDFQKACVALTRDKNGKHPGDSGYDATSVAQYGFSVVPGWPPVEMWIWQAGGDVISADLKTSPLDSQEAIQGAQYLADLINKSGCTPEQSVISDRGFGDMMKNGQVAMFMGGAADDFERTEGVKIKAFMLPKGPQNRQTWAWIGGMSIYAGTKHAAAAYQAFIDLTQTIQEWKVPAPRKSLATREGIIAATPYKEVSADNIVASLPNMRAPRLFPGYAQWATIYSDRFVDPLVRGKSDAGTLAPQVRPLLEDALPK